MLRQLHERGVFLRSKCCLKYNICVENMLHFKCYGPANQRQGRSDQRRAPYRVGGFYRNHGFSLTEVLVSILVLGLGIIGATGMQLNALRMSRQSAFQATALRMAVEMADMIQAKNRQADTSGERFDAIDYRTDAAPIAPPSSCYGDDAVCDADAMARFELYQWKMRLKSELPSARAVVCRDASPWDDARHAYRWDCKTAAAGTDNAPLTIKIGWQGPRPDGVSDQESARRILPAVVLVVGSRVG